MKLDPDVLDSILFNGEFAQYRHVTDYTLSSSRWIKKAAMIFTDGDRIWKAIMTEPLTESVDVPERWETDEQGMVFCPEVEVIEKTVVVYRDKE